MNDKQLETRIAAVRKRRPEFFKSIDRHPTQPAVVNTVRCRISGAVLQAEVEDDQNERVNQINGRTIIYRQTRLAPTPEYAELTMEMDDGSRHATPISASTLSRHVFSQQELEDLYVADLAEWAREGMSAELLETYAARTPVGVLK